MNKEHYLLICLAEEASEVAEAADKLVKRATKAMRFGLDEVQVDQLLTNKERITYTIYDLILELNDLISIADELNMPEIKEAMKIIGDPDSLDRKKERLKQCMELSRSRNILRD